MKNSECFSREADWPKRNLDHFQTLTPSLQEVCDARGSSRTNIKERCFADRKLLTEINTEDSRYQEGVFFEKFTLFSKTVHEIYANFENFCVPGFWCEKENTVLDIQKAFHNWQNDN